MSVIKNHTSGNNQKDYMQHLEHGKSLKSRTINVYLHQDYGVMVYDTTTSVETFA
jgi:hypothetical protein